MSSISCPLLDDSFGPYARHCRGGFDLTLLFQESILSILPLVLLLGVAPLRVVYLIRRSIKVGKGVLLPTKLILYIIYGVLNVALVALWAAPATIKTKASVASAVMTLIGSLALGILSLVEHNKTIRPSLIIESYLGSSLVFDAARVRTLWMQGYNDTVAAVFTVSFAIKAILLCVEALGKRGILRREFNRESSEATSGLLAKLTFWWLNPLFLTGYSRSLSMTDMLPLDKHLTTVYLYRRMNKAWSHAAGKRKSLLMVYLGRLKWHLLSAFPPRLALIGFNFCQPFLISRAISFSQQPKNDNTANVGYGLIGAYFLVYCGIAFTMAQYQHLTYRAITMARGGLISMLFAKSSLLEANKADSASSLTLMSADIERITNGWQTMHEIWANVIEIAIAIWLLEGQLGVACTIPLAVAISSFIGSIFVMNLVVQRQGVWLEAMEKRIGATTTILGAMKRIKMCGLAETIFESVHSLRIKELSISEGFRRLLIGSMFFAFTTPVIAPVLTFTVFSLLAAKSPNSTLDTSTAFTSLSLFALLTDPLSSLIMSMTAFAGSFGCFARIQTFLETQEHEDGSIKALDADTDGSKPSDITSSSNDSLEWTEKPVAASANEKSMTSLTKTDGDALRVTKGSFGWDPEKTPLVSSINTKIPRGKLTMIVGPVGCGKSTFLKALLGEVPSLCGNVKHLFAGDVAYCDQSPFHMNGNIQDSVTAFSELDERWYNTIISACDLDEDFRQMHKGDQTKIGSKGIALSGGQSQRLALARAAYARQECVILDDVFSGLDLDTENRVFRNLLGPEGIFRRQNATVLLASSSSKRLPFADHIIVLGENGTIAEQGTFEDLNREGGFVSSLDLPPGGWDTTKVEKTTLDQLVQSTNKPVPADLPVPVKESRQEEEFEANKRTGDLSIYAYYAGSVGWFPVTAFIVAISCYVFCISFPQIWLGWWSDANVEHPNANLGYWLGIYAMLGVVALASLVLSCWQIIVKMVPRSGGNFHSRLLHTVLSAPMSYFSSTDTGITLNRFSQDLQLIDMDLPVSALNFFTVLVLCLAQIILIGVASTYAAVSFPLWFLALYLIQKYYLRTSRQLRFLDLEAKSPLYTMFSEVIGGLTTVRAFGWQRALEARNRYLLDESQKPFYLLWAVQRWLQLVLDLLVAGVAVMLIILITQLRGFLSGPWVGIALLNVILFSQHLKLVIQYWTLLETHIGAVCRVKNFISTTVSEDSAEPRAAPPPDWPSHGVIDFQSVTASYDGSRKVLKEVSLSIQAGQKIGICGRTGSGKSSLILALFRMIELQSGTITVDEVDIATIPRHEVRSRIIGLPQDVLLLDGTVRLNIDPYKKASDKGIISVLQDVKLWDNIQGKGGLDALVGDINLSHGQKQLFCLAQALLRQSSILVLDEATSSVDDVTDAMIQRIVRQKFPKHTIIAVAHKLDTIVDFDKVAVLENGVLKEFENPGILLADKESAFSKLYSRGGY